MFSCFERTLSRKGISMISLLLDHQSWMISTFVVTGAMGETRPDIIRIRDGARANPRMCACLLGVNMMKNVCFSCFFYFRVGAPTAMIWLRSAPLIYINIM